jgi:spore germination protein GerM
MDLKSVSRQISYKDSPLTDTLTMLVKGPTTSESKDSIISLIPKGTEIKNVFVKGNTAFISFNEEFRFNSFGISGLKAQLKQVVYTTTEFSNISQVQILIDGKKVDYLAQEGVYIGAPLSRNSF